MGKRASWGTRLGFYLVAIGSPCGLGSLWRFPYIVGANGGGAFVLLYMLLMLVIGLPLLVAELILGRSTGKSIMAAAAELEYKGKRPFAGLGRSSVLISFLILAYYTVISGWVLYFAIQFLTATVGFHRLNEINTLGILLKNGYLQVALASVHLLLCIIVVLKGVQEGLEKFIGWTVPVFGVLLLLLVIRSLSLPTAGNAVRFLFYPDFAKLNWFSLGGAIGQVLFTLSIGFGTMVTFGSYMTDEHIPTVSFRVATLDTFISVISGLLIFPIALQASNVPLTDPGLLFESLPRFLLEMQGGALFGFAFFVCLYLAALGASIGILESIVSNGVDRHHLTRQKAAWLTGLMTLALGTLPALSGSSFRDFHVGRKGVMEFLDNMVINWVLPLIAIGIAVAINLGLRLKEKEDLFVDPTKPESEALFFHWLVVLKWVAPAVILCGLLMQLAGFWLG